jgi:hypothetical protein
MADDINSYALNLSFQLKADPAISSLGGILSSITNIQNGIQRIGTTLSHTVTTSLSTIQEQFVKIVASNDDISKTTTKLETDLTAIQKHYDEIDKLNTKTAKTGLKQFLDFDKMRKWVPQLLKEQKLLSIEAKTQSKQQEQISNAIKSDLANGVEVASNADIYAGTSQRIASIWQSINGYGSQSVKQGTSQARTGEQVAAMWHNAGEGVSQTTAKCKEHSLIANTVAAMWTGIKNTVTDTVLKFADMLVGITAIKTAFAGFVEEENKFNTANYRLYGQQKEIIGQVNTLTAKYGLMRRPAMEAMAILGASIRDTDDQLGSMIATNVQFSKILGVNQKDLADWQRAMKSMGIKDAEAILLKYAESMRQLGLSADQMGRILSGQAKSAAEMKFIFGATGTRELNEYTVGLTGLGNKMGWSTEQVNQFTTGMAKHFSDPNLLSRIEGVGRAMTEGYDTMSAADKAKADLRSVVAQYAEANSHITNEKRRLMAMEAQAAQLGFDRQGYMALMELNSVKDVSGKTLNILGKSATDITALATKMSKDLRDKAFEDAKKAGPETLKAFLYNEATSSIADHFTKMWSKLEAATSNLMIRIAPAINWLIDYALVPLIDAISFVINAISGFKPATNKASDALKDVSQNVSPVVSWFEELWGVLSGFGTLLMVVAVGAVAVGAAFVGLSIGLGLWRLFMKITDAGKLLAIAVAAVAVGAGVLLMSFAFEKMGKISWESYGKIAVGLAAIAAAAFVLGMVGWPGVAAMVALGIAAIALSFAVLMLSWAFDHTVDSFIKLLGAANFGEMVALGAGLAVFGVELMVAAVAIGAGATVMIASAIALGVAFAALSIATFLISDEAIDTMTKLSSGILLTFGNALRESAVSIGVGGAEMAISAVALGTGMAALTAAMFLISWDAINGIGQLSDGRLQKFSNALLTLGPGTKSFMESMGWGVDFPKAMRGLSSGVSEIDQNKMDVVGQSLARFSHATSEISGLAAITGYGNRLSIEMIGLSSGINKIDPAKTSIAGQSLTLFGRVLDSISRFNINSISTIGSSLISFTSSLIDAFGALELTSNRAISSITSGFSGIVSVMSQLRDYMTTAFIGLLDVIPTINDVTNRVAAAIESGQNKIKNQVDTLQTSFAALELLSSKLGVSTGIEEPDKKKVMAETISTIQVKTEKSGSSASNLEALLAYNAELMKEIADTVEKINSDSSTSNVDVIKTLLQTYLPKMGESPSKLSTRLNNWA